MSFLFQRPRSRSYSPYRPSAKCHRPSEKLKALSSEQLNIRAEVASGAEIGSVRMALSGAMTSARTEGIAPYALFGDRGGQAFAAGTYTVTATPYPERDLGGTPGPTRRVTFTVAAGGVVVVDGGAPSAAVTSTARGPVSGEFAVTVRFGEPVTGFRMSELAATNGRAMRMVSYPDGMRHEVYVTPDHHHTTTTNPGAGGEVRVTVPAGVATDADGNPNTASATFRIAILWDPLTGFTLFDNANGGADVRSLPAGAAVVVPASSQLNIRAGVRSGASIGSVRMTLSGAMSSSRTEGIAPYALFGDRGGQAFAAGTYTVTATPYPERNLGGTAGQALRVTFRVVRPALSVADARAEEGTDKTIDFTVTLDPSSPSTVTVDYATADGSAFAIDLLRATVRRDGAFERYGGLSAQVSIMSDGEKSSDFNGDSEVGFSDFLLFAAAFGTSADLDRFDAKFDLDSSGDVGFGDFLLFAGQF